MAHPPASGNGSVSSRGGVHMKHIMAIVRLPRALAAKGA
jgi:hypothetical protein